MSQFLQSHGVKPWIEGAVFFSNPRCVVDVYSEKTKVFSSPEELIDFIKHYPAKKQLSENERIMLKSVLTNQY